MPNWREDYLERLAHPGRTPEQVFAQLAAIFAGLGFEYCSFGVRLPGIGGETRESWSTTYPVAWRDHYLGHDYLAIDPVIASALRTDSPVVWDDTLFASQRAFWEEARTHGVRHGWTLAMHGRSGETGLVSLSRTHVAVSVAELDEVEAKLVWLSHTVNGVVGNLLEQQRLHFAVEDLTGREREVLRWTAAGKTSGEIGSILGVSTRTVNFHVAAALFKLDAVNKTQAVVKALMFDLLR